MDFACHFFFILMEAFLRQVMSDSAFLSRLQNYDKDNMPDAISKKLQKWITDDNFVPEVIKATSSACMSLCPAGSLSAHTPYTGCIHIV